MKRRDVIKTLNYVKVAKVFGKPASETNAWLHGIFDLLYGIAEVLDVFEEDEEDEVSNDED
jgi:hypothetical protein